MTSQEKVENEALIVEAKELGIKSPHLCSLETLTRKVAEAKGETQPEEPTAPTQERKKVPKMNVANVAENTRERVADEWRKKEPDCEFVYQRADVTDAELEMKGLQRTGESVKGEVLCRTDKESFNEWMGAQRRADATTMEKIDKDNRIVRRMTEQAR